MQIHLIVDLTREDDKPRVTVQEVMDELENELEGRPLEVGGVVFDVRVAGIGRSVKDVAQSAALRKGGH